jgi:hypothetical protein
MSQWKTRREKIIEILKKSDFSLDLEEISDSTEIYSTGTVLEDLKHIKKSLKNTPYQLLVQAPKCRDCGFIFSKKFNYPSKCPKCRSTWIEPPRFQIKRS